MPTTGIQMCTKRRTTPSSTGAQMPAGAWLDLVCVPSLEVIQVAIQGVFHTKREDAA
ncbi:hypothetical protein SynA1825c_02674 [Synechococcus sp. A18-25c]|nr:hypothetical protein SynA1825c_02674 [Synechococcus sp. A18-25c]